MEGTLERENLPAGKGVVDYPRFLNDVGHPNKGSIAMSSGISKAGSCTFKENRVIGSNEDETDRYTNVPTSNNDHRTEDRPSTHSAETDEHLSKDARDLDTEIPKGRAFVQDYDNVAYVPDELEEEPKLFIIGDGYIQHDSQHTRYGRTRVLGLYVNVESQMGKTTISRQFCRQVVTLLGGCFNTFVCMGFAFSLGALFIDWLEDFQTTRAETAVIQSATAGLTFMGGLVNGFLIQRFGIRAVMCSGSILSSLGLFASWFSTGYIFTVISVGVVLGWGSSMVYLSNMVIVTLAFRDPRAKGFALALLTSSGGVGAIIFPNILQEFKKEFGWRGALLIISGVYLNVALSGLLVTSSLGVPPSARIKNKTNVKGTSKYRRLLNPLYGAYLLCALIGFGSYSATLLIAVDFGISRGLSAETGIVFLLIMNGTSTGTRFMAGVVQMIPGVKTYHVFCLSVMVSSGCLIVLSWADSYDVIIACFTVYGLGAGGMIATLGIVILEVVGEDMYAVSMGLGGLVTGASNTTLGILMGTLYDLTGSYNLPLVIFGSAGVGAVFFPVMIQCVKSIGTRRSVTLAPM
ncbi:monocarboxylate transporter 2-like [Haliotis asinina]|uniref:monocarboxylate transporter 2-like n=1 Tax=Haliotis asinina TaxID=109174 RepID=UPI0035318A17